MTTTIAIVGDIHANSTTAICPPRFQLDDGGDYVASRPQRWLWRQWLIYWDAVKQARQNRLVVILNGELADDLNHASTQLITKNHADMLKLSVEILQPMLKCEPDKIYVTRGTEAHSGLSGWLDEAIAADIGAVKSDTGNSHWRLRLSVDGVKLDVAHHPAGGGGRLPWTRGNFANRLAATAMMEAAMSNDKPPHLFIRGHVHRPADSHDEYPTRAIIHPSWQLTNAYGHRIAGEPLPVGGLIVRIDSGTYAAARHYYKWPLQPYEII